MSYQRATLRMDAWEDYAHGTRGEHFAWWSAENLIQGQDRWAGKPLIMEPDWQLPMLCEALAVDVDGVPYWTTVVIVLNRKNSKTTMLGGYSLYVLDQNHDEPEIILAAGSDKQAGRLFDTCYGFQRRSVYLQSTLIARNHIGEIIRSDQSGKIIRVSSEGAQQHGWNPSLVVIDELHGFRTPKLHRLWGALTTADGAREMAQIFAITTEGEAQGREHSILGQLVDENEELGEIEQQPGLTVSRNHEARTIIFRFHAVDADAADPRPLRSLQGEYRKAQREKDSKQEVILEDQIKLREQMLLNSVMPANPASWITPEYILRQAKSPKVMAADFLQLHCGIASQGKDVWITSDRWDALADPSYLLPMGVVDPWRVIPEDALVAMAVDASYSHDTTAVAWSWMIPGEPLEDPEDASEDEREAALEKWAVGAHVWAARENVAAHTYEDGGVIKMKPVKQFIREFCAAREVVEIAFDPAFFRESAEALEEEGLPMVRMDQQGDGMRNAEQVFHDDVLEKRIVHGGDPVLRQHMKDVVASLRSNGSWQIRKVNQQAAIDGVVAMIMAKNRAQFSARGDAIFVMFT